ncbi:beta-mannosidase [Papilio machaon]|uniref:beta-mannosidase n=1 Tax=Papilio machaon TaxID=76193 RepID=UPI001E6634A3|nr:beta-mannosidase [Papilio machaon]
MQNTFLLCFILLSIQITNIKCEFKRIDLASKRVNWTLSNNKTQISAKVPGGVYTDLQRAGIIDDILSGFNDIQTRWVAYDTWTYKTNFQVSEKDVQSPVANLVFEGVDTIAFIELNDVPIGTTQNMFVRYVFDIKEHLKIGLNELKVTFASPVHAAENRSAKHFTAPACVPDEYNGECHANQLRKMQASFSWDWGPAFPSVGLWKPVYIELYDTAIIRSLTTHTEQNDQLWYLKILAHLESGTRAKRVEGYITAELFVEGHQSLNVAREISIMTRHDGTVEVELNITVHSNVISVWWPNGFGDQPLYDLRVSLSTHKDGNEVSQKHIRIGFRTLELVEEDASKILGNTTAGKGLTFYFKVNGYPMFMKGSNWIPANILPENGYDKRTVDELLTAARDTHMAMLRVWGGGVYESDYFYERCDQLGILIWQDFLFACSMYPADPEFLDNVKVEIEQTVIRLQHHSSIAVWAGNNENEVALRGNWYNTLPEFDKYKDEYIKLYVDTVKPIVETWDPSRRYLVSSPSNGVESEQEGYIAKNPYDSNYGDTHYYNYLSDNWDINIYPKTRFASEYGFQSLPSLKTMATATKNKEDYHVNSSYSKHRQHSPNGYNFITDQMNRHLKLDEHDPKHFEKFVFYSQISQAMAIKAETEFYRQSQADWYTMGALYWQLNDVWQAPSWSSIEYGGKWKMLHYFAKSFFAPVLVSPRLLLTDIVDVYAINDRLVPIIDGKITVDYFNWSSLTPFKSQDFSTNVELLSVKKVTSLGLMNYNNDEIFMRFSLHMEGVSMSPHNFIFPKPLKDIKGLLQPNIKVTVSKNFYKNKLKKTFKYVVNIEVDTVVLFLWLETDALDGHFDDNGLVITQANTLVNYVTKRRITVEELEKNISYQYYIN